MTTIVTLLREKGMMTWEDIQIELGYDDEFMKERMELMMREGEIYEPRPGRYMVLE
jgi:hypothetical protein